MFKKIISVVPFLSLALLSAQSQAVELVDLDLTNPDSRTGVKQELHCWGWGWGCYSTNSPYYAMTYNYETANGELNVTVSGWSYDGSGEIEPEYVGNFSQQSTGGDYGLGVEDEWTPEHAVDNNNGDYDMILLSFDTAVNLEAVEAGWRSNGYSGFNSNGGSSNSEVSLLAFTGDESAKEEFDGQWSSLLSEGWESAGDTVIQNLNQSEDVNAGGLVSQYWLVGAYNSTINGAASGFSDGNDFFKLTGVTVSVSPVPVPGTMLLFGAALLGFGTIRRKRKS